MNRKIRILLIALLAAVLLLSCFKIVYSVLQSKAEDASFKELAALTRMPDKHTAKTTTEPETVPAGSESVETKAMDAADSHAAESTPTEPESVASEPTPVFTRNLSPLFERNADCIGWICIPNTTIDYPVVHTPQEPEKYLRLDFDGAYSRSGVPFLQGNCTLDSDNLIIYGHNMQNGTMFSNLIQYCDRSFCAEHPTIEFETARGRKLYAVYAVALVKETDPWYQFVDAFDEADFVERISELEQIALYSTGDPPQYGQRLLSLSTCYGADKADRLLVIAVEPMQ